MDLGNIYTRRLIGATADQFRQAPTQHAAPHPIRVLSGFVLRTRTSAAPGLERATKRPHSKPTAMQKGLAIGGDWSGIAVNPERPERSEILPRRL
jgi:hypothetical protein